ncbi:MAG: lysine--tRNA ligase [Candidatus Ryanbacteria bacterium CG10_big_fil_rev_8_21_14_0_10_43_42]|uniref:Lysine--tRNA ligase n=1 Tax=Candidatus Ryanbacteria bacterium CG10_big_fil_rev_8_21_14_0_10_43_42 TaxID=1974864 RepID=A0A2M8KW27_9BACT|nr:MAG: lysine--tRNA ligase [Candidatus Ryanbacteria bacterium CG10_big_fil_rev_8_21_14_0_10_43_42]
MSLEEIRTTRLDKLDKIRKAGFNPYPARTKRTHTLTEIGGQFDVLMDEMVPVTVAGRVRAVRGHGGSTFVDIEDGTEHLQLYMKKDTLKDAYDFFLDVGDEGDIIEAVGTVFLTKKEERTLQVTAWRMLAKSILPLPEKWHGLQDIEERFRKRYLDIMFNEDVRVMIQNRARFWHAMRRFMVEEGFLEVETPVLENTAGGADADPFATHHNALDMDVYLRISCGELWQKRLMVAGFPKVFEIGRIFRNEGMSAEHLQDYTQMEFYWAYADYEDGMRFVERLYKYIAKDVFGTLEFTIGDFTIDLDVPWERYDYQAIIRHETGIDVLNTNTEEIEKKIRELGIVYNKGGMNIARGVDTLWKYCRKRVSGPGFLINVPVFLEPLAKRKEGAENLVERFQVILAGSEMGKGYSELNDPIDQRERFEEQQRMRDEGDAEAHMADYDFVEALEYGMPPTCGFGVSERLFSFLSNKSVRETQIFPLMRPK